MREFPVFGKLRGSVIRKPHPLSPSPFRGGGTNFNALFASMSTLLGEMSRMTEGVDLPEIRRSPVPEREGGQGEGFIRKFPLPFARKAV